MFMQNNTTQHKTTYTAKQIKRNKKRAKKNKNKKQKTKYLQKNFDNKKQQQKKWFLIQEEHSY